MEDIGCHLGKEWLNCSWLVIFNVKRFDLYSLGSDDKEDEDGIKAAASGGNPNPYGSCM